MALALDISNDLYATYDQVWSDALAQIRRDSWSMLRARK